MKLRLVIRVLRMRTTLYILLAALFALASSASQAGHASAHYQTAPQASASPPQATAPTVREVDLAGLKKLLSREGEHAHPLVVNFWGTFCDPCRAEMPDLVSINSEFQSRGLEFILVSVDDPSDIKKKVPEFLKQVGAAQMNAYLINEGDPEKVINAVDPTWNGGLPATFLYDAHGRIIFKHTGRVNPAELRQAILKAVTSDQ